MGEQKSGHKVPVNRDSFLIELVRFREQFDAQYPRLASDSSIWPIYSSPRLCGRALDLMSDLITDAIGLESFDCLAGIPTSGYPLAVTLGLRLDKPVFNILKDLFTAPIPDVSGAPIARKKVLLVDSAIRSGLSASLAHDWLECAHAQERGIVVLIWDDLYQPDCVTEFLKASLQREVVWHVLRLSKYQELKERLSEDLRRQPCAAKDDAP